MFSETRNHNQKSFYKIPLFYIAIIFLLAVGFGGGWLVKGKVQKTSTKDCESCGVANPIVIPKSVQSVSAEQGCIAVGMNLQTPAIAIN